MRRHDGVGPLFDRPAERQQLHFIQSIDIMGNERKIVVGIYGGIAVPRKMLGDGRDSAFLIAVNGR
ncbi:hypothetical protein D3C71_1832240 [compost metagenome]